MLDQQYNMELDNTEKKFNQSALYQSFKAGDLLYGRHETRKKYMSELSEKINYTHNITTNQYNNSICINGEINAFRKDLINERNPEAAEKYYHYLLTNRNYQKFTPEKIEASALKDRSLRSKSFLLMLYSCRAAIECPQFSTIHFCLDGVDLKNVQEKIRPPINTDKVKKPAAIDYRITTSELRFIYKNWETLKEKVKFYRDGAIVECPWEASPEEWAKNFLTSAQAKEKLDLIPKPLSKWEERRQSYTQMSVPIAHTDFFKSPHPFLNIVNENDIAEIKNDNPSTKRKAETRENTRNIKQKL